MWLRRLVEAETLIGDGVQVPVLVARPVMAPKALYVAHWRFAPALAVPSLSRLTRSCRQISLHALAARVLCDRPAAREATG